LIHERAVEEMSNQDERRSRRIEWSILSKAADKSRRRRQVTCWWLMMIWSYNEKCSDSCANLFFVSPEQFGIKILYQQCDCWYQQFEFSIWLKRNGNNTNFGYQQIIVDIDNSNCRYWHGGWVVSATASVSVGHRFKSQWWHFFDTL